MQIDHNEQEVRKPSLFLKVEDGSVVVLKSNLVRIKTHFLKPQNKSVLCLEDRCVFCQHGEKAKTEYFYFGSVDSQDGIIRLPGTVFFAMNDAERVTKKDKRGYAWIVGKTGSGLDTTYTVTRDDKVTVTPAEVESNNAKLEQMLGKYENGLREKYEDEVGGAEIPDELPEGGVEGSDDIPF